jgi:hypothetical protein
MDYSKAALVVCVTLFIVIGFNAMIYVSVTRGKTVGTIELLRRAAGRARDPWRTEDVALDELSRLVSTLKSDEGEQGTDDGSPSPDN